MEVMDTPFRAGDLNHGYQAVADNLPNDPRVHEQKGSKKLFFKNFMDARVNYVILPVARHVMLPAQAAKASGEGYLLVEDHCPICAAATTCQGFCSIELEIFGSLLDGGWQIERRDHLLSGARRCAYRITREVIGHGATENEARRR